MTIIEAIILGIIQGLSEFIPISSTAHMTLAGQLMDLIDPNNPDKWTSFIAVVQLGTLAAVLVYFRKDIFGITKDFLGENISNRKKIKEQSINSKLGWLILLGSIPIVTIGLAVKDIIRSNITKDPFVIALSLIIFAIVLMIAELTVKFRKDLKDISILDSIIIGVGQVFALIPGASRSGTTITAGLFMGLNRETAARFSFLLGIPAILGSGLLEFYKASEYLTPNMFIDLLVATLAASISGYWSIAFLLKFLQKNSTFLFVFYRIALGLIILTFFI